MLATGRVVIGADALAHPSDYEGWTQSGIAPEHVMVAIGARILGVALAFVAAWSLPARAGAPAPPTLAPMCDLVEAAAWRQSLPVAFFTRLIWQESRFKVDALSPAGALGVAQFMPATADGRGLVDPFVAADALEASAAYLGELRARFGNLGLAAAAYNAGPGRLARWLAGQADLPQETQNYVQIVTGHPVTHWVDPRLADILDDPRFSCRTAVGPAGALRVTDGRNGSPLDDDRPTEGKPWAAILVANPQRAKVLAEYAMIRGTFSNVLGGVQPSVVRRRFGGFPQARFTVQIEHDSREAATAFCNRLLRSGGACVVLANR